MYEKDRSKILIIGNSQLHHTEESRLSGKNIKALVRSKGGLKVEQVTNRYEELLNEDFDEIIIHVDVNNTEHESEESMTNKFITLNESIKESHVAFRVYCKDLTSLNLIRISPVSTVFKKMYV